VYNNQNNDPLFKLTVAEFKNLFNGDLTALIQDVVDRKLTEKESGRDEFTLDVDGAAKLMNISRQTIYQKIKEIPHRKVFGKLVFFKEELIKFIDNNGKAYSQK